LKPKNRIKQNQNDCEAIAKWLYCRLIENGYYGVRLLVARLADSEGKYSVWVVKEVNGAKYALSRKVQEKLFNQKQFGKKHYIKTFKE
jgi:hypothetical protein